MVSGNPAERDLRYDPAIIHTFHELAIGRTEPAPDPICISPRARRYVLYTPVQYMYSI